MFQVICEPDLLPNPDGPLGRVVLVPLDGVAVVRRKLMVEVMIPFTKSDKSSDEMVARTVTIVERLVPKLVGKGIHTEGSLLDEEYTEDASIDEATEPVIPAETCHECWKNETHEQYHDEVMFMLPDDNHVIVEIGDIGATDSFWVLLYEHPPKV